MGQLLERRKWLLRPLAVELPDCPARAHGFTRPGPAAVTLIAMIASFGLLSVAMRTLPLGTAYTVWTGIGAVGAFLVGVLVLGEPAHATRLLAAGLIIAGIVLMKSA